MLRTTLNYSIIASKSGKSMLESHHYLNKAKNEVSANFINDRKHKVIEAWKRVYYTNRIADDFRTTYVKKLGIKGFKTSIQYRNI